MSWRGLSGLPALDWLVLPLQAWALSGLVGPAIVAACYRGVRNRGDLPIAVRRAAVWSQWMGAYLGYAMGGLLGVALLLPFWVVGLLEAAPPPIRLALLGLVPSSALFLSYAVARSQVRSALALAQFNTTHKTQQSIELNTPEIELDMPELGGGGVRRPPDSL